MGRVSEYRQCMPFALRQNNRMHDDQALTMTMTECKSPIVESTNVPSDVAIEAGGNDAYVFPASPTVIVGVCVIHWSSSQPHHTVHSYIHTYCTVHTV